MTYWKNKNVLVTGAGGFIGGWLTKVLIEKEANVVILERDLGFEGFYKLFNIENKIIIVQGNLTNYGLLERILNEYEIDTCFHLAAQAIVQTANRSPISTFESNIQGTWCLMEACRNTKSIKRVVVASSDKAYGSQKVLPYKEDTPLLGIYPYDASKACSDIIARCYAVTYGLPITVTRNANTYGGGDLNFSRIIPDAICCILTGKDFQIRSDGTLERDYMYVEDAINAYLVLAENIENKNLTGEAFNFGTGQPISVLNLFSKIATICGKPDIKPIILGTAKGEIDRQYLDSSKAMNVLQWKLNYTLEDGLSRAVDWYKKYLNR